MNRTHFGWSRSAQSRALGVGLLFVAQSLTLAQSTSAEDAEANAEAQAYLQAAKTALQAPSTVVRQQAPALFYKAFDVARSRDLVNDAVAGLLVAMRHSDEGVRTAASQRLVRVVDGLADGPVVRTVVVGMATLLANPANGTAIRGNAALSLGKFLLSVEDTEIINAIAGTLMETFKDPDVNLHPYVVKALTEGVQSVDGPSRRRDIALDLAKLLSDPAATVRGRAAETLIQLMVIEHTMDIVQEVAALLAGVVVRPGETAENRAQAARGLGYVGRRLEPEAKPFIITVLKTALQDPSPLVAAAATTALRLVAEPVTD